MRHLFFLLLFAMAMQSCGGSGPKTKTPVANASPLPHGGDVGSTLTASDRVELAKAAGKTAVPVTAPDLALRMDQASEGLHIYYFWSVNNKASTDQLDTLKRFIDKIGTEKLQVIYVALDGTSLAAQVNTTIREKGLTSETLLLDMGNEKNWQASFGAPNWLERQIARALVGGQQRGLVPALSAIVFGERTACAHPAFHRFNIKAINIPVISDRPLWKCRPAPNTAF